MVEYFLKNAEVLEKLTIEISDSIGDGSEDVAEQLLDVARSLLMLPRSSRTCQIEFSVVSNIVSLPSD